MSMEQIKKDIRDELHRDPRVSDRDVEVEVSTKGKVILRGSVPKFTAKRAADQDAKSVKKVSSVINELKVLHPSSVHPPFDSRIRKDIIRSLRLLDDINSDQIDVSVKSGHLRSR